MAQLNEKNFYKVFDKLAKTPSVYELEVGCTRIDYKNGYVLRWVWDIDTGEVYKHQIITLLTDDMVLIVEMCALDNNKVITYTDNGDIIKGARG